MKNRILVVGIVGIFIGVGVGEAREFPKNPDRFPSFGITLESQSLEGDFKSPSAPAFGSQDVESTSRRLTFDTRLPLSNSFTLNLALGLVGGEAEAEETSLLHSAKTEQDGTYFRIGARYYFNR